MFGRKIIDSGPSASPSASDAVASVTSGEKLPEVLDPGKLNDDARKAAQALAREGDSANTRLSYQSAMRYWLGWYRLRYGEALPTPLPPAVIIQFVVDHAVHQSKQGLRTAMPEALDVALVSQGLKARAGPPALATLLHRLSVMAKLHTSRDLPNPCAEPVVRPPPPPPGQPKRTP